VGVRFFDRVPLAFAAMTTQQFLVSSWSWDGAAVVFSALAMLAYVWRFGVNGRMWYLLAAVGAFLLSRISPLNTLAAGYLFSAHMLEHILLLLIVPALTLMSLPRQVSLPWGRSLPAHSLMAWLAGVSAMWLWHARPLCNAAVSSRLVSALQIGSLLGLGAIFWRPILAPRETERMSPPGAVFYLFSACVACSVLGILITFSPVKVCPIYLQPPNDNQAVLELIQVGWGITPEKDQQIGGLLMWVPMCLVYLSAIVAQLARWFAQPLAGPQPAERGSS
jgi:cytochrome c oxidase assembly factor CtaG